MKKWVVKLTVENYMHFVGAFPDDFTAEDVEADVREGYWANGGFEPYIEVEEGEDDDEVGDIG